MREEEDHGELNDVDGLQTVDQARGSPKRIVRDLTLHRPILFNEEVQFMKI